MIAQVTDELVEAIPRSGLEPGAGDVVLEFIGYSGRPLADDLLPQIKVRYSDLTPLAIVKTKFFKVFTVHVSQSSLEELMVILMRLKSLLFCLKPATVLMSLLSLQ
ncbi:unnamed protein product [Eruca vesicaria subsp. sativa]|uniref:Uncharacterized protein n=1 Tax=Eruca vesicaria subsp. sativa TaxID=29727 RepID=A0ABC8L135_ERUVS|nr:unnamed protein product [Eruca vesicaria subsp. sativa]